MVFSNLLEAAAPCWSRRLGDGGFVLYTISKSAVALGLAMPGLKRIMIRVELPGALKRSYPRINAGAST